MEEKGINLIALAGVETGKCPAAMTTKKHCGRKSIDNETGFCLMHATGEKDIDAFTKEIMSMGEKNDIDFTQFVFPDKFSFAKFHFLGDAIFRGATFKGAVQFQETKFDEGVDFSCLTIEEALRPVLFLGPALFTEAYFKKLAFFGSTQFFGPAIFTGAVFDGGAYFGGYWIKDMAEAIQVRFRDRADFRLIRVKQGTFAGKECGFFIAGAIFDNLADFRGGIIETVLYMDFAEFRDEVLFTETFFSTEKKDQWVITGAKFAFPEKVTFYNSNLTRALLRRTDISQVRFVNVKWPTRPNGAHFVWDEARIYESEDFEPLQLGELAHLYHQLKINYENEHRWDIAGDFHIGEMEARRNQIQSKFSFLRFVKRNFSIIGLYNLISLYGENYRRAGFWVLGIPIFFGILYWMLAGFPIELSKILDILYFSISKSSRIIPSPVITWSFEAPIRWVVLIEGIFSPVVVALFVLALRRRFKR